MIAKRFLTGGALAAVAIVAAGLLPPAASASTYSVTSTANAGPGTLRQAIVDANAHPGGDSVRFNLPGPGVQTIAITTSMPAVSETLVINGRSQPGFAGTPLVRVDNASGTQLNGLKIQAGQSEVLGLELTRFAVAVRLLGDANRVQGNLIGTDAAGGAGLGNATGVRVESGAGNRIGGIAQNAPNVISGNTNIGIEMVGAATTDTVVAGNRIGTDPAGTVARANGTGVGVDGGSTQNMIGGTTTAQRNLISGNTALGVRIDGSGTRANTIAGNYIGTTAAGTARLANGSGIRVSNNAGGNMIGGTTAGARNVISGGDCPYPSLGDPEKTAHGVEFLSGASGNTVAGNYIGVDATGSAALHICYGVFVGDPAGSQTIGVPGAGNVISGNSVGVVIRSAGFYDGNVVQANYIGTDASGSAKISQGVGICVCPLQFRRADRNTIGGTTAATRNVISGNGTGVALSRSYRNTISGNYIGTDATGTAPLGNSTGVSMYRVGESTIGGNAAGARNVISANSSRAVSMNRVGDNDVTGNYIGTDVTGSADLGNGAGVTIQTDQFGAAGGNDIDHNVISGNTGYGVIFDGADSNRFAGNAVSGNYIGTNAGGDAALPNGGGVQVLEGPDMNSNTIGGTTAGERNVISGNTGWGVVLSRNSYNNGTSGSNHVVGNYIGTKSGGGHALGNGGGGVLLELGVQEDNVEANRIAFNGGPGVRVDGTPNPMGFVASRDSILGNSMFNNGGLGIDLLNGGNNDQAAPAITAVTTNGGSTTIDGTLDSTASTTFRIELFSSPSCDPSGAGEGKTLLGSVDATSDGAGHATFSSSVAALPPDQTVTTTATNQSTDDTSEFSSCFTSP